MCVCERERENGICTSNVCVREMFGCLRQSVRIKTDVWSSWSWLV